MRAAHEHGVGKILCVGELINSLPDENKEIFMQLLDLLVLILDHAVVG